MRKGPPARSQANGEADPEWSCLRVPSPAALAELARFDTQLPVILRQFPDVGVSLVPVLALAILWPVPRTVWLLLRMRTRPSTP